MLFLKKSMYKPVHTTSTPQELIVFNLKLCSKVMQQDI